MKFLIRETFFKNISSKDKENIMNKLLIFYKIFKEKSFLLTEIPKGYFLKKIKGVKNLYELRINSGDRAFFSINENKNEEENITFLIFSLHDRAIKKAKATFKNDNEKMEIIDKEEILEKKVLEEYHKNYNNVITYEIIEDEQFKIFKNNKKYTYYYLNDEQRDTLKNNLPLCLNGSAGSGKSTITLRKLLEIEENKELYNAKKIAYFTANKFLKDNIENQYINYRKKKYENIVDFFTLKEFFQKNVKISERQIINFNKFKEFFKYSYPNYKKLNLDIEEVYSEITGIIKGTMIEETSDNWNRNIKTKKISLNTYLKLSNKYSVLDKNNRKFIYEISEKYDSWLEINDYYDLNDLARKNIEYIIEKYDYLIIDEIQDLTEVEIYFLFELLKNKGNCLVAGDIHQMVYSSYFSFERLRNYFYKINLKPNENTLTKNYRSCKKIVELANYFTELRSEYIGNLGSEDYKEKFIIDEGNILLEKIDLNLLKDAQKDANMAIIVSDEEEKQKLYEQLENKHRIFTVGEIKGLEYTKVICFNLTTKYIEQWKKILSKTKKQDQRYRKYFNIFYVGITRAREQLLIMEEIIEDNEILKKIEKFVSKTEKYNLKKVIKIQSSSQKDWYEEGERLYKLEKIEEARYAFEQAGYPNLVYERIIEKFIEEEDYKEAIKAIKEYNLTSKIVVYKKKIIDHIMKNKDYILAMEKNTEYNMAYKEKEIKNGLKDQFKNNLLKEKEIKNIIEFLKKRKDYLFLCEIYLELNQFKEALTIYEKQNNKNGIKKVRNKILYNKFNNIKNLDETIKRVLEFIGDKGINNFGKDRYTPLQKSLIVEKNIIFFKMILELGGKVDLLVKGKYSLLEFLPKIENLKINTKIEAFVLIKEKYKNNDNLKKDIDNLLKTIIRKVDLEFLEWIKNAEKKNNDEIFEIALKEMNVKIIKYLFKSGYVLNSNLNLDILEVIPLVNKKLEIKQNIIKKLIKNSKKIIGGY
ncbi:UvrD-helicase domain-containing protein [Cetobacterium ceti]